MRICTYAFVLGIAACLLTACLSARPIATGQNNRIKQSVVDLGKEQITKSDVSGSQNKTVTTVNDPKVLYGVMFLMAAMIAGMFQQQRRAHKYQSKRIEIYHDKGSMVTESKR